MPNRHNEGGDSRNFTQYNFQVLRDDVFMLGRDGTVTGNRIAPVRSSSAVLVSSQNQNREWIYSQQQTVSAEGFAGQTFNTHVPHTVRARETKQCSDCHVSDKNDNNAWLAQVMLQGTNFVNFMGRYVYVAANDALEAVAATEHTDPQAIYGSTLNSDTLSEVDVSNPEDVKALIPSGSSDIMVHFGDQDFLMRYKHFQEHLPEFVARGMKVVAISADSPEESRKLCQQQGYTFPFLSDRSERIFRANHHRSRLEIRTEVLRQDKICDCCRRAFDAGR